MNEEHDKLNTSPQPAQPDTDELNVYAQLQNETYTPPEGWRSANSIAKEFRMTPKTVLRIIDQYREVYPDFYGTFMSRHGLIEYFHPELTQKIKEVIEQKRPPEDWLSPGELAKILGSTYGTVKSKVQVVRGSHPEWFAMFTGSSGHLVEYYSPDLLQYLTQFKLEQPPKGWLSINQIKNEVNSTFQTIKKFVNEYRDSQPEWFQVFNHPQRNRQFEYISPELVSIIKQEFLAFEKPPIGWVNRKEGARNIGIDPQTFDKMANVYTELRPEWFHTYLNKVGKPSEFYSDELCKKIQSIISGQDKAPDDWMSSISLAKELGVAQSVVQRISDEYAQQISDQKGFYVPRGRVNTLAEYYGPELSKEIRKIVNERKNTNAEKDQQRLLTESFTSFLAETKEGELGTKQLRDLTELFGAENIVDIIMLLHPEYKGLSMPYVKSVIPDYLGEFLVIRGELDLETLEFNKELLSNPSLKAGLLEVIKKDCLKHYYKIKHSNHNADDIQIISDYILTLRTKTKGFSTPEIETILEEVSQYYNSVFHDINIPDRMNRELVKDRLFPDINQRINVREIGEKRKMLIADEMGVGKSGSAILAKESLGVKQAVIVAPSNVIATWQAYLSDRIDEKGKQVGYFKPGQAPKVCTIDGPGKLKEELGDFEYVLISQEKMNDKYIEKLLSLDYGMLVLDETHKFKNISQGKRAANVLKLVEAIGDDENKYLTLLSGTPVPNKVGDVAMVLKLLYPEKFSSVPNNELTSQIVNGDILDIRNLLVPRMEAKSLTESIEMPNLTEKTTYVQLSREQRQIYEALLEEDELEANQKIHLLRQFVINPEILEITPSEVGSKVEAVGESLRKDFATKDKIVMFVNGYKVGVLRGEAAIFDNLRLPPEVEVMIVDGDNRQQRAEIQHKFQTDNGKMLLAVNGQTADVGVDFSSGQAVKEYNEPWTEYDKRQQIGRVYRYGLQHDITSETFIVEGTIEEGIHTHIQAKYEAVEKLLRGVPLSEIEKQLLRQAERFDDNDLEVNADLAQNYLSSWGNLMKIFGNTKEIGEEKFVEQFLPKHGREYANAYIDIGSRSYQSNASRVAGTLINNFIKTSNVKTKPRILDIASGPEILRRHIPDKYASRIISVDINERHFAEPTNKAATGSFLQLPIKNNSVDYANLALALHYTSFAPTRGNYERLEVLQEINRVLHTGGKAVISLMYNLDLKDPTEFEKVIAKCGFKINKQYTGEIEESGTFKTRVITLEKTAECNPNTADLASQIGRTVLNGLKFSNQKTSLKDSRKIITHFRLGRKNHAVKFNKADLRVLSEEHAIITKMEELREKFGGIDSIPVSDIVRSKMARIKIGNKYILFKTLKSASGAVRLG